MAVAAGAALSSPRVRGMLRKGAVQALAGAMQAREQLSETLAARAAESRAANGAGGDSSRAPARARRAGSSGS